MTEIAYALRPYFENDEKEKDFGKGFTVFRWSYGFFRAIMNMRANSTMTTITSTSVTMP